MIVENNNNNNNNISIYLHKIWFKKILKSKKKKKYNIIRNNRIIYPIYF